MENCSCGRPANRVKRHCPYCGSNFTYARQRSGRIEEVIDPATNKMVKIRVKGWACRNCGEGFADDVPCVAPEPTPKAITRIEVQQAARAAKLGTVRATKHVKGNITPMFQEDLIKGLAQINPYVAERMREQNALVTNNENSAGGNAGESTLDELIEGSITSEAEQNDAKPISGSAAGPYKDGIFDE